jgi:hypothetical protein
MAPPELAPRAQLRSVVVALFRDREPQRALRLLSRYTPTHPYDKAAARYLRSLALTYKGDTTRAQASYCVIMRDFPDMRWAQLARRALP